MKFRTLVLVFIHTEFINYNYGHSGNLNQDLSRKQIQQNPVGNRLSLRQVFPTSSGCLTVKDPQRYHEVVSYSTKLDGYG